MVLGHSPKKFHHMMKSIVSALITHERIETTHAKAKRLMRATNKLFHFAKKAEKGFTSPINLLKGRVTTEQVYKKLLMETIPKLEHISQNYVTISKSLRYRRGDNAPMVWVTIKGSEKEEMARVQIEQAKKRKNTVNVNSFNKKILAEEKAYYEQLSKSKPQLAALLKGKIGRVQFEEWALDKPKGDKRLNLVV